MLWALFFVPCTYAAAAIIDSRLELPYSFAGRQESAAPGTRLQARLSFEAVDMKSTVYPLRLYLPQGITPQRSEGWSCEALSQGGLLLSRNVEITDGYGQWFDLLTLDLAQDLPEGDVAFIFQAGTLQRTCTLQITGQRHALQTPVIRKISLPLDKDGRRDERQAEGTLALRDRRADGYKNLLLGKGASNQELEALHPLAYVGVEIENPGGHQTAAQLTIRLLDKNSGAILPGLLTPGSTGDEKESNGVSEANEGLCALISLSGEPKQRLILPVYADERLLSGGAYLLEATLDDANGEIHQLRQPVELIRQNPTVLLMALTIAMSFFGAALCLLRRLPAMLRSWKSRRLVTTALFGAAVFVTVNVPTTLLGDFFHILLGPFSFLLTGLFSGSVFYLLLLALVIQVPRPGVIALLFLIRLLLGMLAFGHVSPLIFLSYALQALLLECAFRFARVYPEKGGAFCGHGIRQEVLLALFCAAADCIATYGSLQLSAWLHRLYYADWYIALLLVINGFCYTICGVFGGLRLGRYLAQVGGD